MIKLIVCTMFNKPLAGIDSISRMHMIRSLPKTRDYILKNDFIELKGYNKVGENTFPNIMVSLKKHLTFF